MPQGKFKVKAKLPSSIKQKKSKKGPSVSKSKNCPITPKKRKFEESHKIKKMITKTVNDKMELEMRSRAGNNKKTFSKVEEAVAAYNKAKQNASKSE